MNTKSIAEYYQLVNLIDRSNDPVVKDNFYKRLADIRETLTEEEKELINNHSSLQEIKKMTNIFDNKEDYMKLKTFWKKYHAEKRYARVPVEFHRYDYTVKDVVVAGTHMVSPLQLAHHAIYLAATGKSLEKAFGKCWSETINVLCYTLHRNYWNSLFKLFEDSIDEKYRERICEKILAWCHTRN